MFPFSFQYEWIEKHIGQEWLDKIIITWDKTVIEGDLLFDDKVDITGKKIATWNLFSVVFF